MTGARMMINHWMRFSLVSFAVRVYDDWICLGYTNTYRRTYKIVCVINPQHAPMYIYISLYIFKAFQARDRSQLSRNYQSLILAWELQWSTNKHVFVIKHKHKAANKKFESRYLLQCSTSGQLLFRAVTSSVGKMTDVGSPTTGCCQGSRSCYYSPWNTYQIRHAPTICCGCCKTMIIHNDNNHSNNSNNSNK